MRRLLPILLAAAALPAAPAETLAPAARVASGECVVLLHGLARTSRSMAKAAEVLAAHGYATVNVDYPSREKRIAALAAAAVPPAIAACRAQHARKIHFLTHSLGGIVVRHYLASHALPALGRVVMLSPPSQGSEVVDALADVPGFAALNGPAGAELGTGPGSVPRALGAVHYEVGVITGNRSLNPLLSLLIPGADDGKVSVERARLEGMTDFLVVPRTHTFIMRSDEVIRQAIHFLQTGRFHRPGGA